MKILFDLSATQPMHGYMFHGGGEYAKTVFYKLCEHSFPLFQMDVFYDPDKPLDMDIGNIIEKLNLPAYFCGNNLQINSLLNKNRYDVFYTALPYSYQDISLPSTTKFIYTVHGLRSLEYPWDKYAVYYKKTNLKDMIKHIIISIIDVFLPEYYITRVRKKNRIVFEKLFSLTNNQLLITVSLHSKYSLKYFFPAIKLSSIRTLYSPQKLITENNADELSVLDKFSLQAHKYLLLTGGDRYEKGIYFACRALYNLLAIRKNVFLEDIKIIILGIKNKDFFKKTTKGSRRFVFEDYIPSAELEVLYKNAHLFVYPTLNEGFGYPPLEAMKYNTLCACSANSAITEICGDAVLYFNPKDAVEMGIRVLQSFDEEIQKDKRKKMKDRLRFINDKQDRDLETLAGLITGASGDSGLDPGGFLETKDRVV